jgi:hypothetical protein
LSSAYQIEFDLSTGYHDNRKIKCRKWINIIVITVICLGNATLLGLSIYRITQGNTITGGGQLWEIVFIGFVTTLIILLALYKVHKIMMQFPVIQRSQYIMKLFLILFDLGQLCIILYLIVTTIFQKGETDASVHTMIWTVFFLSLNNLLISFAIQIFIAYLMVKFSVPLPKRRDTVLKKDITLI